MDSSTALATGGLSLPNFPLATGDLLHVIENSVSVISTSTDDAGEYYSMAMASVVPAREVKERAVIIIPLSAPRADEALDLSDVAAADCMYYQLHQTPQPRCTYGHCAAY
jgi:hypothetical protein